MNEQNIIEELESLKKVIRMLKRENRILRDEIDIVTSQRNEYIEKYCGLVNVIDDIKNTINYIN